MSVVLIRVLPCPALLALVWLALLLPGVASTSAVALRGSSAPLTDVPAYGDSENTSIFWVKAMADGRTFLYINHGPVKLPTGSCGAGRPTMSVVDLDTPLGQAALGIAMQASLLLQQGVSGFHLAVMEWSNTCSRDGVTADLTGIAFCSPKDTLCRVVP